MFQLPVVKFPPRVQSVLRGGVCFLQGLRRILLECFVFDAARCCGGMESFVRGAGCGHGGRKRKEEKEGGRRKEQSNFVSTTFSI